MPTNFQIYPLKKEINLWIISILEKLKQTTQSRTEPIKTRKEHGNDGSPGWHRWAGGTTPILLGLKELKRSEWSDPLRSLSGEANTVLHDTQIHWSRAQSARQISNLATSFLDNNFPDPRLSIYGKTDRHLSKIIKAFKRSDPREKPQKAATPMLLKHLFTRKDEFSKHITDLINGAFFYACRSCEYSKVSGTRKTKVITIRNIKFRKGNRVLKYEKLYHTADSVSITFISQKNEMNYETVTQHKNSHPIQNPVLLWASIVTRVLKIPGTTIDSPVNTFFNPSSQRIELITSDQIL